MDACRLGRQAGGGCGQHPVAAALTPAAEAGCALGGCFQPVYWAVCPRRGCVGRRLHRPRLPGGGFNDDALLAQAGVDVLGAEGVEQGGHGYAQHHTGQAGDAAAHGDDQQHPHAGQAHGLSNHPGINQVALDLLEGGDKDDEPQGPAETLLHEVMKAANMAPAKAPTMGIRAITPMTTLMTGIGEAE